MDDPVEAALSALRPPADPRTALPAFGGMPVVAEVAPLVTRVIAPNPSPMTLDGTNTYVVGAPGTGEVVVVDPGPDDPDHRDRVAQVVADRDAQVAAVVTTHHHHDHSAAVRSWAAAFGAVAVATTADVAGPDGTLLRDGAVVECRDASLTAVATPGHCADHLAFRLPDGSLLVGDHVLGRGTSVVAHPDGDLEAYLASVRRVLALGPDLLLPGHGPELAEDPSAVLRFYLDHRAFRSAQIQAVLAVGPATPAQLVERIYVEVPRVVWPAAEASTRAALASMQRQGLVVMDVDDTARLVAA